MIPMLIVIVAGVFLAICSCGKAPPGQTQPSPTSAPGLPDLVLTDIILKPKPAGYGYESDVIINTVVRNDGAACTQGFVVWCSFSCSGNPRYFSGMELPNGLGSNQQITLGDDALLSLSDCSFQPQREFVCTADSENHVAESNESNNDRTEVLQTGR